MPDGSDRGSLERELCYARRFELLGTLAPGLAHEINTPVQYAGDSVHFLSGAFADLLRLVDGYRELVAALDPAVVPARLLGSVRQAEQESDLEYLRVEGPLASVRASDGLRRVAEIVRAMRTLAYRSTGGTVQADLNEAIRNIVTIARNEYKYVADLELDLAPIPLVWCEVADIGYALLALLTEAVRAVATAVGETGGRGCITIRSIHDGDCVAIRVTSTGRQAPEALRERVLQPCLVEGDASDHAARVLAVARALVVDRHGGRLALDDPAGAGTSITIRLPIGGREPTWSEVA